MENRNKLLGIVEGTTAVIATLIALFAPIVRLDMFLASAELSAVDLIAQSSRFREYLGDATALVGMLVVMVLAAIAAGARLAIKGFGAAQTKPTGKQHKFTPEGAVFVIYAIVIGLLLAYLGKGAYGMIAATGWIMILFLFGAALIVLDALIAKAVGQNQRPAPVARGR